MYTSTCRPFALFLLLTIAEGTKVEEKVEGATKHSRNSEGLTPGDICGKSNNQENIGSRRMCAWTTLGSLDGAECREHSFSIGYAKDDIHGCLIVEGQVFCTCTKATACFEDVFDTVLTENAAEHDELLCIWEQWQKQTHGKREKRNDPWVENKQINMAELFMTPEEDTTYYYDERTIYHDIPESRPPLGQEPDVTMRFTAGMTRRPRPRGPRRTRPPKKSTTTKPAGAKEVLKNNTALMLIIGGAVGSLLLVLICCVACTGSARRQKKTELVLKKSHKVRKSRKSYKTYRPSRR
ncbi:hypothetical protein Q1695_007345 [Nippostrongylus brasiliensis]|nr:hypothetical protein Q1695_007345 [Nippostrongylus brasiliensis]